MTLYQWAIKWGVSAAALDDLTRQLTSIKTDPGAPVDARAGSEGSNQNLTRLDAARHDCRLWRNNVGACTDDAGNSIRYGLCNDSKEINSVCKSSDLIGIRRVHITQDMVGGFIGQFVAREEKPSNWTFTGTAREQAQLNFINLVVAMGGDAKFNNAGRF